MGTFLYFYRQKIVVAFFYDKILSFWYFTHQYVLLSKTWAQAGSDDLPVLSQSVMWHCVSRSASVFTTQCKTTSKPSVNPSVHCSVKTEQINISNCSGPVDDLCILLNCGLSSSGLSSSVLDYPHLWLVCGTPALPQHLWHTCGTPVVPVIYMHVMLTPANFSHSCVVQI